MQLALDSRLAMQTVLLPSLTASPTRIQQLLISPSAVCKVASRAELQLAVQASQLGGLEDQMFHRPLLDLNMMVRLHVHEGLAASASAAASQL